jgi:predicted nucleic acid-binding protein
MAMTVVDPVFVDTNILVFAASRNAPLYQAARQKLADLRRDGAFLWVSRQVLHEYLTVMSRPQRFQNPTPMSVLITDVLDFQRRFLVADEDSAITANLLALLSSIPCGGKQVHDANIVATMQAHGLRGLLTDNVGDFQRFTAWIDIVPWSRPPEGESDEEA